MSFKPTLTRRDFLKSTSTGIGSLCTLSAASQFSPLIAKPAELTPSLMAKAISVHIPLWHQGQLDSHKFWNEVFQDLSAHKIQHCFLLNYHFVDPVMGKISKRSQFNNNQAPELSFLADGMKLAQERGIKASLYPVLEIDNPHQIGGIWRGNLNFFGRTLETFFQQYMRLIDDILDISLTQNSPYLFIGSELASLSHNIAARPFWEELIYRLKKTKQQQNGSHKMSLIYAAHWEEYLSFPFWRHMDEIGINAYFPLGTAEQAQDIGAPSQQSIQNNLEKKLSELRAFSLQHKRPIHITEFGLTSYNQSVVTPWGKSNDDRLDSDEQLNGYKALLSSLYNEQVQAQKKNAASWLKGASFWHWKLPYRHGSDYNIRPFGELARLLKNSISK